jgi:hypothetical protein
MVHKMALTADLGEIENLIAKEVLGSEVGLLRGLNLG